jgi:hypothetical protein
LTAACSDGSKGGAGGAAGGALPLAGQAAGGVTELGGLTSLAGTTSAGGVVALGGNTGSSTIPLTGACANLTCMNSMLTLLSNPACQTSATDTCTQSMTMGTALLMNECYSSGAKMQVSMDMSSATAPTVMTVKSGSSVCYSMRMTGDSLTGTTGGVTTIAFLNASGATVATIVEDSTTTPAVETVTCPGGAPTVIDATCGSGGTSGVGSFPGSNTTATCIDGVCTF